MTGCGLEYVAPGAWTGLEKVLRGLDLTSNRLLPSYPGQSDVIFFNDSFTQLEQLQTLTINDNYHQIRLSPLALLSSQYSLQELSLKSSQSSKVTAFSPHKFEMHFPNVRKLSLSKVASGSRLTRYDLLGFGDYNLEELDISSCDLIELTDDCFEPTPSIKKLNLAQNALRRFHENTFKPLSRTLIELNLNEALVAFRSNLNCDLLFGQLPNLITISMNGNQLELHNFNCFAQLANLQHLSFDFNNQQHLKSNFLAPNTNLKSFSISFNKLLEINQCAFCELDQIEHIDLSFNLIKKVSQGAFVNLQNVKVINLQNNDLQLIEFESFSYLPSLEQLILINNHLINFNLKYFDQIGTLTNFNLQIDNNEINFNHNYYNSQEHRQMQQEKLIYNNYLTQNNINSIELLNLSNNQLITFESQTVLSTITNSLTQLVLSNNYITNVTSSSVSKLKNLQFLDLSNNRIEAVFPDAFREDFSLQVSHLQSNRRSFM